MARKAYDEQRNDKPEVRRGAKAAGKSARPHPRDDADIRDDVQPDARETKWPYRELVKRGAKISG